MMAGMSLVHALPPKPNKNGTVSIPSRNFFAPMAPSVPTPAAAPVTTGEQASIPPTIQSNENAYEIFTKEYLQSLKHKAKTLTIGHNAIPLPLPGQAALYHYFGKEGQAQGKKPLYRLLIITDKQPTNGFNFVHFYVRKSTGHDANTTQKWNKALIIDNLTEADIKNDNHSTDGFIHFINDEHGNFELDFQEAVNIDAIIQPTGTTAQ